MEAGLEGSRHRSARLPYPTDGECLTEAGELLVLRKSEFEDWRFHIGRRSFDIDGRWIDVRFWLIDITMLRIDVDPPLRLIDLSFPDIEHSSGGFMNRGVHIDRERGEFDWRRREVAKQATPFETWAFDITTPSLGIDPSGSEVGLRARELTTRLGHLIFSLRATGEVAIETRERIFRPVFSE